MLLKSAFIISLLTVLHAAYTLKGRYPLQFGSFSSLKIPLSQIFRLKSQYSGNKHIVITKQSEGYGQFTSAWNIALFAPSTYTQAQTVFNLIRKYDQPFVIRGGGHDFECSSTTLSVLISLKNLNRITPVYSDSKAVVQAGAMLIDVLNAVKGSEYEAVTGECPTVGISGFTLGGGINLLLSKRYGIGAQNVIAIKAILANGKLVTITWDNEYKDLLWGLLGYGGGKLAFVVEFTIKLHRYPQRYYNMLTVTYNFANLDQGSEKATKKIVKQWVATTDKINQNYPESGSVVAMNSKNVLKISYLCRSCDWRVLVLNQFYPQVAHQVIQLKRLTYQQLYETQFLPALKNFKLPGGFSTLSAFSKDSDLIDQFIEQKFSHKNQISFFFQDTYNMVKDEQRTSYPFKEAKFQLTLDYYAKQANLEPQFRKQQKELQDKLEKHSSYLGSYVNYVSQAIRSEKIYFGKNTEQLRKLKRKYDGMNVFHR